MYDFFCGGGCFSTAVAGEDAGEEDAGATVEFGVDHWGVAVATFQRNHARAAVRGVALPATWAALRPPEPLLDAPVHAHLSPPYDYALCITPYVSVPTSQSSALRRLACPCALAAIERSSDDAQTGRCAVNESAR